MMTDTDDDTTTDPRWAQVVARDARADGRFWYSVATTGVYCRPSCPSRTANPKNVRFHATPAVARAHGFRPCRRCNPDGLSTDAANAALIEKLCRLIEASDRPPALAALAASIELSPSHCLRLFKTVTGVTPKAYAEAKRAARVRGELASEKTVTAALHTAGFNGSGRFYAKSTALLGMTPQTYRAGGIAETLRFAIGQCDLGAILVASSAKGVAAILIGDDPDTLLRDLQDRFPHADLVGGDEAYERQVAKIVGFVEAPRLGLDLPLDIRGTAFQQRVWQALRDIPAGRTVTYAEMAARIGAPKAVRAVASACAKNPLAVAIPCHRVVHTGDKQARYRWGVARKHALLDREGAA